MEPAKSAGCEENVKNRVLKLSGGLLAIALIIGGGIFAIVKLSRNKETASIVASSFVGYDFARAVTGDESGVSMLLKPGAEMHDFEPSPEDIIKIKNADLFIYVGGESDEWVEDLLGDNEVPKEKTLRLMDLVELKEEELAEGMEEHERHDEEESEYDEHIWTSPVNAIKLVNGLKDKLSDIHPEQKDVYAKNASAYTSRLSEIDQKIRDVVAAGSKKELIFGDRFPFRYFTDEYGLNYYAAFPGCSEQTEASSQTVAFLIDKIKSDDVKTILKIELTSDKLAQSIADETGAKLMTLNSAHNISNEDFNSGRTYADIMETNIETLKEALK